MTTTTIMDLAAPLEPSVARRLRRLARMHGVRPVADLIGVTRHAVAVAGAELPLSRATRDRIERRLAELAAEDTAR